MSAAAQPRAARRLSRSPGPAGSGTDKQQERDKPSSPSTRDQETTGDCKPKKRLPAGGVPSLLLRRQELLLRCGASAGGRTTTGTTPRHHPPPSSLTASFASEASTDSFCSRASTGRIGRPAARRRAAPGSAKPPAARPSTTTARKAESAFVTAAAMVGAMVGSVNGDAASPSAGPARCPWVTPNTDPCYAAFHDQEWGIPVHDDKRLFEMLVLSGALAEMAWPVILSKRETFREVFMDFDPVLVAKLNEKKFSGPCSPASSLLSEHRVRIIIENARELLKVIDEFGSFDRYCWGFVSNNKPLIGRFRHTREVPLRTAKADAVSQDLMRRGFRGVGPTVVYAFMQAVGMANDHLVTCYRFEECCNTAAATDVRDGRRRHGDKPPAAAVSDQEVSMVCGLVQCAGLEPPRAATVISIS